MVSQTRNSTNNNITLEVHESVDYKMLLLARN